MDIYQRYCKKIGPALDLKEDEVEILDAESVEEACEEEHCEEEEEVDCQAIERELECMKRRIQFLQLKLKMRNAPECPEEECVDFETELKCSENKEICNLQKAHYKLQCQITEILRVCKFAKEQILDLRKRMCDRARDIHKLQKMVEVLEIWKQTLMSEFGVCIERFEYLKNVKAEWRDVLELVDKHKIHIDKIEDNFVKKTCFQIQKKQFITEITELKNLFRELFELQADRFNNLEKRLQQGMIIPILMPIHQMEKVKSEPSMKTKKMLKKIKK